jgi:type I restriction enzyme S subunit
MQFTAKSEAYSYGEIFEISNKRNTDNAITNVLSASQTRGMIGRNEIDIDIKFNPSSTRTYKVVQPGDYIIHLRSFQGGFAFSDQKGICSPAYVVLRPKPILEYAFLSEYFMSDKFIQTLKLVTYGIRDGKSINVSEFMKLSIAIPSREEQKQVKTILKALNERLQQSNAFLELLKCQKHYLQKHLFI